jgi:maleate isomerase
MQQYRSKGAIGFIVPPRCNETVLEEAFRVRPPGLTWCFASLGLSEFGQQNFDAALALTEAAAKDLAVRKVSVVVLAGLPLQTARGPKYYRELEARLQATVGDAIPVATDGRLVIEALQAVGAKRVSVVTPYQKPYLDNLGHMLEAHDLEVVSAVGEELSLAELISDLHFDSAYEKTMQSLREQPDTDAIYISCPQWPIVDSIARIERETGKPVVTQLTSILWWTLATLRLDERVGGFGRLLEEMPSAARATA